VGNSKAKKAETETRKAARRSRRRILTPLVTDKRFKRTREDPGKQEGGEE
jgi:hypothetical protein